MGGFKTAEVRLEGFEATKVGLGGLLLARQQVVVGDDGRAQDDLITLQVT